MLSGEWRYARDPSGETAEDVAGPVHRRLGQGRVRVRAERQRGQLLTTCEDEPVGAPTVVVESGRGGLVAERRLVDAEHGHDEAPHEDPREVGHVHTATAVQATPQELRHRCRRLRHEVSSSGIGEEVTGPSAERVVAATVEEVLHPVTEHLGPQVTDAALPEQ